MAAQVDFEALFEEVPSPLALLSPDLVFDAANRAYRELLGRPREALLGHNVLEVFPGSLSPEEARMLRTSMDKSLREGKSEILALRRYDMEVPGSPGAVEERYWSVLISPLLDREGVFRGTIIQPQDVSAFVQQARRRGLPVSTKAALSHLAAVEAELLTRTSRLHEINQQLRREQAQDHQEAESLRRVVRRQREAVSDTSHDLRGPITGLQLRLQNALDEPEADLRGAVRAALRDAERLGGIVEDLLELARTEGGGSALAEPVDLTLLIRGELAHMTSEITIATRLEPGVVVAGFPVRLARLVNNLLTNAQRHARSWLEVRTSVQDGRAVLEVIDDGPGIPDADKEAVFARFFRRHDARRGDPGGSGLGLPIARKIAQEHGGTLEAADHADGTPGARLVLRIPLHRDAPPRR